LTFSGNDESINASPSTIAEWDYFQRHRPAHPRISALLTEQQAIPMPSDREVVPREAASGRFAKAARSTVSVRAISCGDRSGDFASVEGKPAKTFRGRPPPGLIDLDALPDSALLTERETASILRFSMSHLGHWRFHHPEHPLKWKKIEGRVYYSVRAIRAFIAGGSGTDHGDTTPRKAKGKPKPRE
jgi:hypothetical protein